ncbi:hypothetical protein [Bosea sp. BIWAKO-01]|uniref:hypothetical protein n=1 Tax=Bosea sp. BIWAKO-01 TaxID=506668 RepID=UPI000853AF25|nr:hypothetical protein [Bosea sp. BIWAKO-01]
MSVFPVEGSRPWTHEILIPIGGPGFLSRLEEIDAWLTHWDVIHEMKAVIESGIVIRFAEERFARAFAEAFALDPRKLPDATGTCRCSSDLQGH